ncbi:hypothetical protein LIER_35085 [Lithospermum erythrorhizon]|uniref:Reverse transcriptase n=1 Tax=Lithospermum erythrorhizon TaxID=34254 RepID=A0AAV3NJB7_LITER
MGDFNDILESAEKEGSNERSEASIWVFREFVDQGALLDMGGGLCLIRDGSGKMVVKRWLGWHGRTCEGVTVVPDLRKNNAWAVEEVYWQTNARNQHLKARDKNTKFFHASAMIRRRQNTVQGMENRDGVWKEGLDKVEIIMEDYFKEIFTANDVCVRDRVLSNVPIRVISEMNHRLTRSITSEEITAAVFEMPADKSSGLDGITVMANRLRPVLMEIISETQNAILPGRIISGNILIAHEVLHFMNHNKLGLDTSMEIKLDTSKVYARVE